MLYDILKLAFSGANTQEVKIKRGTLEVGPGCISYVLFEEELPSRCYVPLARLESFRYFDHSQTEGP